MLNDASNINVNISKILFQNSHKISIYRLDVSTILFSAKFLNFSMETTCFYCCLNVRFPALFGGFHFSTIYEQIKQKSVAKDKRQQTVGIGFR